MVDVRIVHVDLPESGNFVVHARSAEQAESALVLDIFFIGRALPGYKQSNT